MRLIRSISRLRSRFSGSSRERALDNERIREEFEHLQFASAAMQKLLDAYTFQSVLDIGSGAGEHSDVFLRHGKSVTALDYGKSVYFQRHDNDQSDLQVLVLDFNSFEPVEQYDCVWCSHVLEHQLDVQAFLLRVGRCLKEGGVLAITVPPMRSEIVGGHVSFWNGGLLLYRLVLAGFDCANARLLRYGYNVSVLIQKKSIDVKGVLSYDAGDIRRIRQYLPSQLEYRPNDIDDPFEGDIEEIGWSVEC